MGENHIMTHNESGYELLAEGIILQAARDYTQAYFRHEIYGPNGTAAIERFFETSLIYAAICPNTPPEELLRTIRHGVEYFRVRATRMLAGDFISKTRQPKNAAFRCRCCGAPVYIVRHKSGNFFNFKYAKCSGCGICITTENDEGSGRG